MSGELYLSRAKREIERLRLEAWQKEQADERAIESSDRDGICAICMGIASILEAPWDLRAEISLRPCSELEKNECHDHRDLFPKIIEEATLSEEILLRKPARRDLLYVVPDYYRYQPNRATLEAPWEPLAVPEQEKTAGALPDEQYAAAEVSLDEDGHVSKVLHDDLRAQPRIIDPNYIEISLLIGWLSTCRKEHQEKCGATEFEHTSQIRPALLIDVKNKCLVDGSAHSPSYVALSYVWGMNQFFTTVENRESLTVPGSLDKLQGVPRTVKESIALTDAIGERYLWIDALCIVQDHESREQQLNNMSSIFGNACLTIVHADGSNANAGFRGLRNISAKRHANQRVISVGKQPRKIIKPSSRQVWSGPMLAPWCNRAWTFQEEVCSRRVLYFAHDSVRWACRTCRWSEESDAADSMLTYASAEQLKLSLDSPRLSNSSMPQLSEFQALVNGFNTRALTFPEDALLAFAGVATRLGSKFAGGLISGLPELFFDICLLWRPQRRKGPPLRRHSSKLGRPSSVPPSWSWAGWDTEVTWPFTWNCTSEIAAPFPAMVGNMRPFYQTNMHFLDADLNEIRINNRWLDYACSALSIEDFLPRGWQRNEVLPIRTRRSDDPETSSSYSHTSDPSTSFWFPVPICEEPSTPRNVQVLSFETTSGQFKLGKRHRFTTTIHALDDTPIGTLWQHDELDPAYVRATEEGATIQLIAVLGTVVPKGYYQSVTGSSAITTTATDLSTSNPQPPSRIQEVYATMWIEWDDEGQFASRNGTGIIDRRAWDVHAGKEAVKILLQ